MLADLAALWRESDKIPRFALLVAAAALVVHVASLLGAGWSQLAVLGVGLHLSVMSLVFATIGRVVRGHITAMRNASSPRAPVPARRRLVALRVGLAFYALLWFFGVFLYYGEGTTDIRHGQHVWVRRGEVVREFSPSQALWFDAHTLSVFSAAWLAVALPLALALQARTTGVIEPDLAA